MVERHLLPVLAARLDEMPAVALLGPRQVGKTTLALELARSRPARYFDLELRSDRDALVVEPESTLGAYRDELVILDEVHHVPDLFQTLRALIDQGKRSGLRTGRFLLLGSASLDLLRQSESLAGRVSYIELPPIGPLEIPPPRTDELWVRGGFPDSLEAASDAASLRWRSDLLRAYVHREIPMFAPRASAETLDRLWTMLAHAHGTTLNAARLATSLDVSAKTVSTYVDLLVDLMLVRRLRPWSGNVGKRLVRAPKVYIRDSGLLHALLAVEDLDALHRHPILGASWEGFVIEAILTTVGERALPSYVRTSNGAEIDLVLEFRSGDTWAIEIKRGAGARPSRGFHSARELVSASRSFVVNAGATRTPLGTDVELIGLHALLTELVSHVER